MATGTHTGANYAVVSAPTPDTYLYASQWKGKVRCLEDIVTVGAAGDAGSILKVGKLPKSCIPLFTLIKYSGSDTATLAIGSSADTDLLGVATAIGTTPVQTILPTVANTPLTADTEIEILTAADGIASGDTLQVKIFYAHQ